MQTRIFAALLIGSALAGSAVAETVEINGQVEVMASQVDRPKRGTTMDEVELWPQDLSASPDLLCENGWDGQWDPATDRCLLTSN